MTNPVYRPLGKDILGEYFWIPSFPDLSSLNYISLQLMILMSFIAKYLDKQI